jgi:hypothetical protein
MEVLFVWCGIGVLWWALAHVPRTDDGDTSPAERTGLSGNLDRDASLAWIQFPIKTPS